MCLFYRYEVVLIAKLCALRRKKNLELVFGVPFLLFEGSFHFATGEGGKVGFQVCAFVL